MTGELQRLAAPVVSDIGVELVELELKGSGRRRVVRLFIDRPGPTGVNHDDCKAVSQAFGSVLDEVDLLDDGFLLEVSSPGADRPIRSDEDFRRNCGRRVLVHTSEAIDGESEFRGELVGHSNEWIRLKENGANERTIPTGTVLDARLDVEF